MDDEAYTPQQVSLGVKCPNLQDLHLKGWDNGNKCLRTSQEVSSSNRHTM